MMEENEMEKESIGEAFFRAYKEMVEKDSKEREIRSMIEEMIYQKMNGIEARITNIEARITKLENERKIFIKLTRKEDKYEFICFK